MMKGEEESAGTMAVVTGGAYEVRHALSTVSYSRSLGIFRLQRDYGLTPHLAAVVAELAQIGGQA